MKKYHCLVLCSFIRISLFIDLAKSDQVSLLRSNLNELYILSIAQYCSTRQIHPKCNSTVLLHSPATSRENSNKRGFNSTNCHLNKPSISLQQQQQHQQQQQKQQQFVQMQHIQYLQYIEQQRRKTFVQRENQSTPENNATNTITTVFEDLVGKFSCLQTDNVEFSYLKALVLFNPGIFLFVIFDKKVIKPFISLSANIKHTRNRKFPLL